MSFLSFTREGHICHSSPVRVKSRVVMTQLEKLSIVLNLLNFGIQPTVFGNELYFTTTLNSIISGLWLAGRYSNIDRQEKICHLCNINEVRDEYYYLLKCSYFKLDREIYIQDQYTNHPTTLTMRQIMNSTDINQLIKLSKFMSILLSHFIQRCWELSYHTHDISFYVDLLSSLLLILILINLS